MASKKDEVRRELYETGGVKDSNFVSDVLMECSKEGEFNLERIYEFIDWREGFLGGYCAETNEPHRPEDFSRVGGLLRELAGLDYFECRKCGLSVTEKRYERLAEVSEFREGLEKSTKTLKISVESDRVTERGGK